MDLTSIFDQYKGTSASSTPSALPTGGSFDTKSIFDQYKASNPAAIKTTPSTSNDWYSQMKVGAYNPTQNTTLEAPHSPTLKEKFQKNAQGIVNTANEIKQGKSDPASLGIQIGGGVAQGVNDTFKSGMEGLDKAQGGLPSKISNLILSKLIPGYSSLTHPPEVVQKALDGLKTTTEELAKQHPEAAKNLNALSQVVQAVPTLMGLGEGAVGTGERIAKLPETAGKVKANIIPKIKGATNLGSKLAKYGTSQATGLSPDTITRIISNPDEFSPEAMKGYTREGVAGQALGDVNRRLEVISETGREYGPIRQNKVPVNIPEGTFESVFSENGIKIKDGKLIFDKESTPTSAGDRAALQDWYTTYGKDVGHTGNSFLNARKGLDHVAQWDSTKTDAANVLAMKLRTKLNEVGRSQVPGLEDLDARFSQEVSDLKQVKKDYFNVDGTMKDNAISKIANLSNEGREAVLARLEEVSPGIGEKVRTLKAVEDIQKASGQKVGTYARGGVIVGGIMTGNIPAIVTAVLSEPNIATKILRGYGKMLGAEDSAIGKIIKDYSENAPKTAADTTNQNINLMNSSENANNVIDNPLNPPKSEGKSTIPQNRENVNNPPNLNNPAMGQTVGQRAIETLLKKKSGEIPKAFYRSDLGDIDLIWGNTGSKGHGLAHIYEQRPEIIGQLDDIITNGKIIRQDAKSAYIQKGDKTVPIRLDRLGKPKKWVLTAYGTK